MPDDWSDFFPKDDPERRIARGNEIRVLIEDDRTVHKLWEIIDRAGERVWMTMYLLAPDRVGLGTLERLTDAARRGADVLLVYDALASAPLRDRHLAPLRAAGGQAAAFNPVWPPWAARGLVGIRNHRKLLISDREAALCGGLNLSDDYVGQQLGPDEFDDTMALLRGPSVRFLSDVFLRTWHEVTGETRAGSFDTTPLEDDVTVEVLETDPRRPETRLREILARAIARCRSRCRLITPYFIPADWLTEALLEAAARGADVQVMTAGRTDNVVARAAARQRYGRLLRAGVRIFELYGRMLHTKALTIDGAFGSIGSFNMDEWTARHTLDVNITVLDEAFASELEEEFDRCLRNASEFTAEEYRRRGWPTRLLQKGALALALRL